MQWVRIGFGRGLLVILGSWFEKLGCFGIVVWFIRLFLSGSLVLKSNKKVLMLCEELCGIWSVGDLIEIC